MDLASHRVRHSGKRLEVVALDLSGTLKEVLERVNRLAAKVLTLRDEARGGVQNHDPTGWRTHAEAVPEGLARASAGRNAAMW